MIVREGDAVVVRIADDGRGFETAVQRAGRGLANQRKRTAELGGHIDIRSGPGGTTLELRLPITRELAAQERNGSSPAVAP